MINKDFVAKVIRKHSSDPEYRKRVQQSGNSGIEIKCRRSDVLRGCRTQEPRDERGITNGFYAPFSSKDSQWRRSVVGIERILRRARLVAPRRAAPRRIAPVHALPSRLSTPSTLDSSGFDRPRLRRLRRTPSKARKLVEGASWNIILTETSATGD